MLKTNKTAGRPRSFDREEALAKALSLFWQKGYEPVTIAELCETIGINPPSLYAAFGNKSRLFLEAVAYYETKYWDATWDAMLEEPDVQRAISSFFIEAARILCSQDAPCGCMVVLGAVNISSESTEIAEALKAMRFEGKSCFEKRLAKAVKTGELASDTDIQTLASALNMLLEGMSVQARDGLTQNELEKIGSLAAGLLHQA